MRLLFIHGAGGFVEDRRIADDLGSALGCPVEMPQMPSEDMSVDAWAAPIRQALNGLAVDDLLVAHSFGCSILLPVLAERTAAPVQAALLAMPSWAPDGWDVPAYSFGGSELPQRLTLHHCRDDEVVPFSHLALNAARLPAAEVHEYETGGHQFHSQVAAIAAELKKS